MNNILVIGNGYVGKASAILMIESGFFRIVQCES